MCTHVRMCACTCAHIWAYRGIGETSKNKAPHESSRATRAKTEYNIVGAITEVTTHLWQF